MHIDSVLGYNEDLAYMALPAPYRASERSTPAAS